MIKTHSRVSIGMPVYNGERFIAKALESLLNQSFQDWELLISDNVSTDTTQSICSAYCQKDSRIHYIRQKDHLAALLNFKFVLAQAQSPFFMWAAADDEWEPLFLEACIKGLENKPEAGFAFSNMVSIDSYGRIIREIPSFKPFANEDRPASVASYVLAPEFLGKANLIYGIYRLNVVSDYLDYALSSSMLANAGFDMALVLGALCRSSIVVDERVLFKKRLVRETDRPGSVAKIAAILPYTNTLPQEEIDQYFEAMCALSKATSYAALVESLLEYRFNLNRDLLEQQKSERKKISISKFLNLGAGDNKMMRKSFQKLKKARNILLQMYRFRVQRLVQKKNKDRNEQRAIQFYSRFIHNDSLCFDVGANVGNRTRLFLTLGARVVAVEPQIHCAELLSREFGSNPKFSLVTKALGAAAGMAEMQISNADTISSLSSEWIDSVKKSGRFSDYSWEQKQTVAVTTLDWLISQYGVPDFIKIDVEGFEYQVIKGLSQPVRAISFEFTPEYFEPVMLCLEHLESIGRIQLNYSLGESMELALERWIFSRELAETLSKYKNSNSVFGDVYVRFLDFKK